MARVLLQRRYWERIQERRARLGLGISGEWRPSLMPEFIDYWPAVPGTYPEKILFAELIRRRVNFYYATYFGDIPFTDDKQERYRPDFLLPDFNIIIEIQGIYWHTRPGMFEHDALKHALFAAAGYKVYFITDRDITADVISTIDREIPELLNPSIHGSNAIVGENPVDPTAPLRSRLQQWPKVGAAKYPSQRKGVITAWKGKTYAREEQPPVGPLYSHHLAPEGQLKDWDEIGIEWKEWMTDLADYFKSPVNQKRSEDLYNYYLNWRNWWNKFRS